MKMDYHKLKDDLVAWIKDQVHGAGCHGAVFGLSGGVDSAVIAGLCRKAFGRTGALGIIMPIDSNPQDEQHALLVAEKLDVEYEKVDLSAVNRQLLNLYAPGTEEAASNVKPRLRMTTLFYYAQSRQFLVAGSSNKSEFLVGYFTKFGDSGVDFLPLADLVKHDVWELARVLGVPNEIIDKPPSAGLFAGQTDEEDMGISYVQLDRYIRTGEGEPEVVAKIEAMMRRSSHKRVFPKIYCIEG